MVLEPVCDWRPKRAVRGAGYSLRLPVTGHRPRRRIASSRQIFHQYTEFGRHVIIAGVSLPPVRDDVPPDTISIANVIAKDTDTCLFVVRDVRKYATSFLSQRACYVDSYPSNWKIDFLTCHLLMFGLEDNHFCLFLV